MFKSRNRRVYLAVAVISGLLMLVVLNLPFKAKPLGDITFHAEAKNLALYLKGYVPAKDVVITKAPGPVLFFAIPYLMAPHDASDDLLWSYGVAFTFLVVMVAMMLVFRIATAFFSREVGILSLAVFFIFPIHCYYSLGIIGEGAAFFSVALALFGWSKVYFNPKDVAGWCWFVVGFLFLLLNRPNAMLAIGFFFVALLYAYIWKRQFFKVFARPIFISGVVISLLFLGTMQTAKAITGNASSPQADYFYYVALQGRYQFRDEPTDFRFWDNSKRGDSKDYQDWKRKFGELESKIAAEKTTSGAVYQQFLIDDIASHPFTTLRQFFTRIVFGNVFIINSVKPENFKFGPLRGPLAFTCLHIAINFVSILLFVGIGIFLYKEKNQMQFWPFWSVILALIAFHCMTYMEPRYLFPSRLALYILSAAGLYQIDFVKKWTDKATRQFFPVSSKQPVEQ